MPLPAALDIVQGVPMLAGQARSVQHAADCHQACSPEWVAGKRPLSLEPVVCAGSISAETHNSLERELSQLAAVVAADCLKLAV